jgi:ribonuclease J
VKIRIHRGTAEIGGNCIEVESQGKSILLDLGMPLMGNLSPEAAMPAVSGLRDGTNANLLGIVISHPHADHYGLAAHAHSSIPVHIGAKADKLLRAAAPFTPFGVAFAHVSHYRHRQAFEIGPFRLTPYLVDHSAFDAHAILIEADGVRLFYSGDLRGHGRKSRLFDALALNGPKAVDLMLLEGTTLSRQQDRRSETEDELVDRIADSIATTKGMVLAAFSGQNIDRFVTFYKAARKARRTFVADFYLAHLLRALGQSSLPDPTQPPLRVYLPRSNKLRIVRGRRFDLVEPYRTRRIYPQELQTRAKSLMMSFRASMAQELERANCLAGGKLIYSMWPGYIERSEPDLRTWCDRHDLGFEVVHTSGHADFHDLARLVKGMAPRRLIPVHTLAAERFRDFTVEIVQARDGKWIAVG